MPSDCFVHPSFDVPSKADVHTHLCDGLPTFDFSGQPFCILHLPDKNKSIPKFRTRYNEICSSVEEKYNQIVASTLPDEEKKKLVDNLCYDFRYVYFPVDFHFNRKNFVAFADFGWTTFQPVYFSFANFSKGASFTKSIFEGYATFRNSNFRGATFFDSCIFSEEVDLEETRFCGQGGVSFVKSTFKGQARFRDSRYYSNAFFAEADFEKNVYFTQARFYSKGIADFERSRFRGDSFFQDTRFAGTTSFNSAVFGPDSDVFFRRTVFLKTPNFRFLTAENSLTFEGIGVSKNAALDLQNSAFARATRVLFQSSALRPNWFVNCKASEIDFHDIDWRFGLSPQRKIREEAHQLQRRIRIEKIYRLLSISFRQLADNSEKNSRFDEASQFRRLAMEAEWVEKKARFCESISLLDRENEKLKRRFSGSKAATDRPTPPTSSFGILRRSGDLLIHGLYRFTSFYGESWVWATIVLGLIILVIFPTIYTLIDFQVSPRNIPLEVVVVECDKVVEFLRTDCKLETRSLNFWSEAIPHSVANATLQSVEYRIPRTTAGLIISFLENVLAPLQAALLALALRRKFLRG